MREFNSCLELQAQHKLNFNELEGKLDNINSSLYLSLANSVDFIMFKQKSQGRILIASALQSIQTALSWHTYSVSRDCLVSQTTM